MTNTMYSTTVDFGSLDEIRDAALAVLPADVADFLEGGAGTESTLRRNRSAFERYAILPEPMSGVGDPSIATEILGIGIDLPVLTAPFGGDALFHPDGHRAVATAAADAGTVDIVPEAGSFSYTQVRKDAPRAARIAQLHPFTHAARVADLIADAGYDAICVTVDCPMGGFRTRNMRNRFSPDLLAFSGNVVVADGPGEAGDGPRVAEVMGQLMGSGESAWSWGDLAAAARDFQLPWIAKGILTPTAAHRALAAGASALVVSNHGGRQVDPAPASLDVLPAIRAAVGPDVPVLVDSGIRTGADVFVALALGADAVIIGRAAIYGLAAAGQAGVHRVLTLIAEELRVLMTLSGVATVADITADRLMEVRS
ncbi:alpha-hydroxy acid oxidase [Williamsia herbipolensis]|uniref:alpha-hydroxy acid oxidase n=1 Tax=Williamsia herbipolensis TaxID=1603258 RepID=UPI000698A000|nr:alpha-hydroxy acid oxidase [Williamsia herbipolensis]